MFSTIELPALYPIVSFGPDSFDSEQAFSLAQVLLSVNAALIQLRYKGEQRPEFHQCAESIIKERKNLGSSSKIIINDDVALASELSADGVHLGQDDEAIESARRRLGEKAIIGLSTHTIKQVEAAAQTSANYLGFGPIFESKTKQGHAEICGCEMLAQACAVSKKPIVAIGGISRDRAERIFAHGAHSAAVISDLHADALSEESISNLLRWYESARERTSKEH